MKKLSINTDDFGLSADINRGIKEAYAGGRLTDASLMANGPAFEDAVDIAKDTGMPLCAHINLIRGKMLSGMDTYRGIRSLWLDSLTGEGRKRIEREAGLQIERILKENLIINQLNSEKHTHFFPVLFELFIKLAQSYKIPYIRFINEFGISFSLQGIKAWILGSFAGMNRGWMKRSSVGRADWFRGIGVSGKLDRDNIKEVLSGIKPGHTEFMVHIGYEGEIDGIMGRYFLNRQREGELDALLSVEDGFFFENDIELVSFGGGYGNK